MFNVGGGELLVILLIALIVLGPQRLPDAARQVGKVMGEIRRVSSGFQSELKTAFDADAEVAPSRKVTPLAASVAEADAEAVAGATDVPDATDGDDAVGEQDSGVEDAPPEIASAVPGADGSPPALAGDDTGADTGDAAGAVDRVGAGAPAAAAVEVADETPAPPAPSSVARPVADALDEIVAPLDDQRAAS